MKAVILAGGGGTRLYPLSTPERPKQFIDLISDKTMLEEAVERLDFLKPEDIYIAVNKNHLHFINELCPQIPKKNIIIEPDLRDTASCIGFSAGIIEKRHPNEAMIIIYADHLISNKKEFQEKAKVAEQICYSENTLNIIEVKAESPETKYGYVKIGRLLKKNDQAEVYEFKSFTEKPDLKTAEKFLKSGNYLWNTGIYVWRAKTLLEQYKKLKPETYEKIIKMANSYDTSSQEKTIKAIYPTLEKISIDYAIMEKVDPKNVRIIKADLGLTDVGSFETLYKELEKRNQHEKIIKFKKIQEN
jgi:mannose-1-phosphate guanylyltransferase